MLHFFISFFFSSRRRHTRLTCDWSSDVCSSDLRPVVFSSQLPVAFRGPLPEDAKPVATIPIGSPRLKPPAVDVRQQALISEMYRDTPLAAAVSEGFAVREGV